MSGSRFFLFDLRAVARATLRGVPMARHSIAAGSVDRAMRAGQPARLAFTLIELLVAVTIIGMLAGLALGGMYRANIAAKQLNTKTTVNRVAVQISEIWESYRTRKLPIDPKLILQSQGNPPYQYQYLNAVAWLQYFATIRTAAGIPTATTFYPDPKSTFGNGVNPSNSLQIAALRLAAARELMRLELPSTFDDFLTPKQTNPPDPTPSANYAPVTTLLIPQPMSGSGTPLANPGGLSEQYRQFFITHATEYNEQYQNAECLYMIIKFASQNELGQRSIVDDPRLVGDVDGDGMPEIQDSFSAASSTPTPGSPYTQYNNPISFVRWPVGYISDLQPQPAMLSATQYNYEYAASRHDIFDPLRIDPRAFVLTPLVYSGGLDGAYGLWDWEMLFTQQTPPKLQTQTLLDLNDPFWADTNHALLGTQMDLNTPAPATGTGAYLDNITNHLLSTSR